MPPRYSSLLSSAASLGSASPRIVRVLIAFNLALTIALLTIGYALYTSPPRPSSHPAVSTTSHTPLFNLTCSPPPSPLTPPLHPSLASHLPLPALFPSTWSGLTGLHDYAAFHSLALTNSLSSLPRSNLFFQPHPPPPQYLIWSMRDYLGAGFGNRLIGALSALYLAMATRRVFLLQDDKLDAALRINAIDYRDVQQRRHSSSLHIQLPLNTQQDLGCADLQSLWAEHSTITVETTQYFLPILSHNPHLVDWSQRTFGADTSLFAQHLLAYLFLPSPALEQLVLSYAKEHRFRAMVLDPYTPKTWSGRTWKVSPTPPLLPHTPVIGLQIRREHLYDADRESAYFFTCAQAVHAELTHALQAGGRALQPLRVFVATDKADETLAVARRYLPEGVEVLRYEGAHAALVDLYVLSLTDELVVTWPRSTFGTIAVALAGVAPYAVHSSRGMRGVCTRQLSTEPCYHGWFRRRDLKCWGEETHETWEMLNMDNCYQCNGNGGCAEGLDEPSDNACPFGSCPPKYD